MDRLQSPIPSLRGWIIPVSDPSMPTWLETGRAQVVAITDDEALRAAYELTRREGIIPALESAHALAALEKVTFAPDELVVLTLSRSG